MAAADTEYAARFVGPELIERGRANALTCPVYRDGSLVSPTQSGSSITIWNKAGEAVVDAEAITVSGLPASASYTTGTLSAQSLGDRWQVEWMLIIDGTPYKFRRDAALCRARLHPVITDLDLYARHRELSDLKGDQSSYQAWIDEAWAELLHMLRQKGSLPHLVMSPEDLRLAHVFLTLQGVFLDFQTSGGNDSKWGQLATFYSERFRSTFGNLSLKYDTDDDGKADSGRRAVPSVTFLGGHGTDPWGRRSGAF